VDNYDSFTYNIYQMICQISDKEVRVFRNDKITVAELAALNPEAVIISPGPGTPDEAGISIEAIKHFAGKVPVLGVCLGHQSIGQAFGGTIVGAKNIVHGKVQEIKNDGKGLFRKLRPASPFTRYHSLVVEEKSLPSYLEITARSEDGEIMGLRHKEFLVEGVQFHPESIGSEEGRQLLKNFLHYKLEPFNKQGILNRLMAGQSLTLQESSEFFDELTEGDLSDVYIASVLSGIGARGATAEEIAGCVEVLHRKKKKVPVKGPVLDTCGTGGDGLHTFNISSLAAITAAACGARIAKHGNRAVSSKSGSADYYKALGINFDLTPEQAAALIDKEGFAFLFAPLYHKAMRFAAPVRAEMGVKTLMNLLGPLANPAEAEYQLIGVYTSDLCPTIARAAKMLGLKRVMTVHSHDGQDEISIASPTRLFLIDENGTEHDTVFDPASVGISGFTLGDLAAGTADENAAATGDILTGKAGEAVRKATALNAGAALYVYGSVPTLEEGYKKALAALDSGAVKAKLDAVVKASRELAS
jgi:anthranilate synthase/phosphoribosyltransferase